MVRLQFRVELGDLVVPQPAVVRACRLPGLRGRGRHLPGSQMT